MSEDIARLARVVSVDPVTKRVTLRFSGSSSTVPAYGSGGDLYAGDSVVAVRVPDKHDWIVVSRAMVESTDGVSGDYDSHSAHPPKDFAVIAHPPSLYIAQWSSWPGNNVCFHVQHANVPDSAFASESFTGGTQFVYRDESDWDYYRYFRVRAMRVVGRGDKVETSTWTPWTKVQRVWDEIAVGSDLVYAGSDITLISSPSFYYVDPSSYNEKVLVRETVNIHIANTDPQLPTGAKYAQYVVTLPLTVADAAYTVEIDVLDGPCSYSVNQKTSTGFVIYLIAMSGSYNFSPDVRYTVRLI